jgi:hypothetical protein
MNFGLENCARMRLKERSSQRKLHIGRTFEKDIKGLDPREAYMYLGIEERHDIEHKIEKGKLKKECFRGW